MMLVKRNYQPTFNSLVNDFFKNDWNDRLDSEYGNAKPKTNISETDESYKLEMLTPGFDKSDLHITIEDNLLTISVEREENKEEESDNTFFREFSINNFKRSFRLSNKVDKDKIEANFNNGILSVNIPKKEESIIKKMIEIK